MCDLVVRELLPVEVALHQRLVRLDDRVEQLLAVLGDLALQLGGNLAGGAFPFALRARVRLHVQEVDDAGHFVLGADRQVHRNAAVGELVAQRLEGAKEFGPLAVEHVDHHDA